LCFDVIQDFLDDVWVSDPKAAPSDDAHCAATQWAPGDAETIRAMLAQFTVCQI
jgi:hypothetical protein